MLSRDSGRHDGTSRKTTPSAAVMNVSVAVRPLRRKTRSPPRDFLPSSFSSSGLTTRA